MARVLEGLRLQIFHWLVPPTPISYTEQSGHCDERRLSDWKEEKKKRTVRRKECGFREETHIL